MTSNLINPKSLILFKILKGIQFISRVAYKKLKYPESRWVTINNFDKDISMKIDPSRPIGGALYWTGFHEFRELIFLNQHLTPDMVLIDVGANLGEFTLFAAKRLTRGKVVAFEPLPGMVELLRHNVSLNHFENVLIIPFGLAEVSKTVPLFTPSSDDGNEGLATLFPDSNTKTSLLIELKTLDEEFDRFNLSRVDVIKLDIEGAELLALKGSEQTLRRFRPLVIIEINKKTFEAAGYSGETVMEFFRQHRYRPFALNKNGNPESLSDLPLFGNVLFKPME